MSIVWHCLIVLIKTWDSIDIFFNEKLATELQNKRSITTICISWSTFLMNRFLSFTVNHSLSIAQITRWALLKSLNEQPIDQTELQNFSISIPYVLFGMMSIWSDNGRKKTCIGFVKLFQVEDCEMSRFFFILISDQSWIIIQIR